MEPKTISDCLSSIDFAIVENVTLLSIKIWKTFIII